ncbi:MAG TPA: class I SAM-dependent methyltransferase [Acidobacteriota bacterium]|nr:class I SAM-dependent methyltransferase [Acidobacteriota bacterium]
MTYLDHSSASAKFEEGSFRDRSGRIVYSSGSVLRVLSPEALSIWEELSKAKFYNEQMSHGNIVQTERAENNELKNFDSHEEWAGVLKHEKISFVSYPYEWTFSMLQDAAMLQLDLLAAALREGFILKDATPYNVQWKGAKPVFIDILSFKKLSKGEPWTGYKQFCEMHLFPLWLIAFKEIPYHSWMRGSIDGIPVEDFANLLSFRDLFRNGVFMHAYLQSKLQNKYGNNRSDVRTELKSVGFNEELIRRNVSNLRKKVQNLEWKRSKSEWSDYASDNSYSAEDQKQKVEFVQSAVASKHWNLVWDLGCNVGIFSRIAAQNADYVVAMDGDHLTVERLYRNLKAEKSENILPLVMNLADSSPGLGWRGQERKSLLERGKPDLILCLALIHHMVISANIPLHEFVRWLADIGSSVIIEFPLKEDPMVRHLLRNKDDQYSEYTLQIFERLIASHFDIQAREELSSKTRVLFYLQPKVR